MSGLTPVGVILIGVGSYLIWYGVKHPTVTGSTSPVSHAKTQLKKLGTSHG